MTEVEVDTVAKFVVYLPVLPLVFERRKIVEALLGNLDARYLVLVCFVPCRILLVVLLRQDASWVFFFNAVL